MHRNVIGLIALDFVPRFILAGVIHIPLVINVLDVDPDNPAADGSGFRIPAHVMSILNRFAIKVISFAARRPKLSCRGHGRNRELPAAPVLDALLAGDLATDVNSTSVAPRPSGRLIAD